MPTEYIELFKEIVIKASTLAKSFNSKLTEITEDDFEVIYIPKGEKAGSLPKDKMAIYSFYYPEEDKFLKIGQANYKSNAWYQSQHYNCNSSKSNLAKSLINDKNKPSINESNVKDWIINNCEKYDIFINNKYDKPLLDYIEGLLLYTFNPEYEK